MFEAGFTDAANGTEFGLSIVQRIVDGHGWTVTVTGSETGGARFPRPGPRCENEQAQGD